MSGLLASNRSAELESWGRSRRRAHFPRFGGTPSWQGRVPLPLYIRARFRFPLVSLSGGDLLVERVGVGLSVLDSVEVLAVDVGEPRAVAGVAEEQVEDRPDE
jgi:hypothetical protein